MGECGCGASIACVYRLPGPLVSSKTAPHTKETTYLVQVYPGCPDCETPVGVIIGRMSSEDVEMFDVEDVPEPEWEKHGDDVAIKIADPEDILTRLKADMLQVIPDSYDKQEDYLDDNFKRLFYDSVREQEP